MEYSALIAPAPLFLNGNMKTFLLLLLASGSAMAADATLQTCRAINDAGQRLACYDALAVLPAPPRQADEQSFGLAPKKDAIASIESTIPGKFDGWVPNQQIKLANGQVWRVIDDSTGVVFGTDLKVTLERGMMGNTFLVIEGTNRSPRVKRLQ